MLCHIGKEILLQTGESEFTAVKREPSALVYVGKRVPNQSKVLLKSPLGSSLAVALTPELASEEQRSVLFADPQHKPMAKWSGLGGY